MAFRPSSKIKDQYDIICLTWNSRPSKRNTQGLLSSLIFIGIQSQRRIMSMIRGVTFCLLLYMTATLGGITMLCPLLPYLLLPVIGKVYLFRWMVDIMLGGFWNTFVVVLLRHLAGIKVEVFGDAVDMTEGSLYIMNHRTRLDWLYIWDALLRFGDLHKMKTILKSELKKLPGPGWSMQFGLYIFLKRRWEEDKVTIKKICAHFGDIFYKPQLLLFPEGTDFTKATKVRSDAFAEKNHLPKYDFVLHPRTTGFVYFVEQMRENKILDAVYDITVAYPRGFPHNEKAILQGQFPAKVHFHVKRYPIGDLPLDRAELGQWCSQRWAEKEQRLMEFYRHSSFNTDHSPKQNTRRTFLLTYRFLVMLLWPVLGIYLMYKYLFLTWTSILFLVVHRCLDTFTEGFDMLQIDIYNSFYGKKPAN